jgi:hypothetical protein
MVRQAAVRAAVIKFDSGGAPEHNGRSHLQSPCIPAIGEPRDQPIFGTTYSA